LKTLVKILVSHIDAGNLRWPQLKSKYDSRLRSSELSIPIKRLSKRLHN